MKLNAYRLLDILSDYNPRIVGSNIRMICPECKHDEFYVAIDKNNHPFRCWRAIHCGFTGNVYTLFHKTGNQQYLSKDNVNIHHKKLILEQPKKLILNVPAISMPFGYTQVSNHPYLVGRNIQIPDNLPMGVTKLSPKLKDRIIFLVYENHELKGWVARKTTETKHDKYYNTPDVDFGKILYGLDDISSDTKTVILVEGIIDKLNVDSLMGEGNIKCLATFGNKISKEQIIKLHNKCPNCNIILMYDPDAVSQMQQYSFDIELYFHTRIAKITCGKDPGKMDKEELITTLGNLWSPYEYFVRHLNVVLNESKSNSRT